MGFRNNLWMLQQFFKSVSGLRNNFNSVSEMVQGCYTGCFMLFEWVFRDVPGVIQVCFRFSGVDVSRGV